jgi:hypothetical protein
MKVFLSHSTKEKQFVQTFAAELKAEKIDRARTSQCSEPRNGDLLLRLDCVGGLRPGSIG